MKFSTSLLATILLATEALSATPKNSGLSRRLQRRARAVRESGNKSKNSNSSTKTEVTHATASSSSSSSIEYSKNWSGMIHNSPPIGQTFNEVSGKITVPSPLVPSGVQSTNGKYAASAWVGIDGNTYRTAILQTGIDFTVSTSGQVKYEAWYEWYPDYASDFDLDISAGDVITMYVNATTNTSGSATIENLTTGKNVTKALTSSSALGGKNAEWIVEDFEENGSLVAFVDFGNVTFSNCVASTSVSSEGLGNATVVDFQNSDNEIITNVTKISDSSFEVTYTGSSSGSTTSSGAGTGSTSGFGGMGMGMCVGKAFGISNVTSTSGAGSSKGFPVLRRFLWGRLSRFGGI